MKILTIDGATKDTGVVIVNNGQPLEWNIISAKGDDVWDRVEDFGVQLYELLCIHKPDVVGYEYPSGNSSHSTNLKLGALMFVAIEAFRRYKKYHNSLAEIIFVKPTQVKATGAHKNAPEFAGEAFNYRFSWSTKAEKKRLGNVWDAIGVWLYLKGQGYV